jgi:hypothetical protein
MSRFVLSAALACATASTASHKSASLFDGRPALAFDKTQVGRAARAHPVKSDLSVSNYKIGLNSGFFEILIRCRHTRHPRRSPSFDCQPDGQRTSICMKSTGRWRQGTKWPCRGVTLRYIREKSPRNVGNDDISCFQRDRVFGHTGFFLGSPLARRVRLARTTSRRRIEKHAFLFSVPLCAEASVGRYVVTRELTGRTGRVAAASAANLR